MRMTRKRCALAEVNLPRNAPTPARTPRWEVLRGCSGGPQPACREGARSRENGEAMRVLMIEDEVPLAEAVARGLRREGYDVECVHDGLSGLDRARASAYDAIILD